MKKVILLILCLSLILSILSGCSGSNAPSATANSSTQKAEKSESGQQVTLKYLDGYAGKNKESLALFEKQNPNIKVDYDYVPTEQYYAKFSTLAAAGQVPDVIWSQSAFLNDMVKQDLLKDITEDLKGQNYEKDAVWQDTFVPGLIQNNRNLLGALGSEYLSKSFGVPFTMTTIAVVYDKNQFKKLGLTAPKTWEEFTKVNDALKAEGVTPLSMIQPWLDWYPRLFWDQFCRETLDQNIHAFEQGTMTFKDENVKKGLVEFKNMWDKGWLPKSGVTDTRETMQQLFVQRKVAQFITVPSLLPYLVENVPADVELASYSLPGIAGLPSRSLGGSSHVYSIAKSSKHQEESLLLLKFLTSKTNFGQEYSKYINSGLLNVKQDPSLEQLLEGYTNAAAGGFSPDIYVPVNANKDMVNAGLNDLFPNYLMGKYDIDYVATQFQKLYQDTYLSKMKK